MLFGPSAVWFVAFKRLYSTISEPTLRGAWLLAMVYITFPLVLVSAFPLLPFFWLMLGIPLGQVFYHCFIKVACKQSIAEPAKPTAVEPQMRL